MGSQQFCLKWNNHHSNLVGVFEKLLAQESFVDVTLTCEGKKLKAHRIVLSACSPFFESLFEENPCKHPIIVLRDMKFCELKAIIDFMYHGEASICQEQLPVLLNTAKFLQVRGLAEMSGPSTHQSSDKNTAETNSLTTSHQKRSVGDKEGLKNPMIKQSSSFLPNNKDSSEVLVKHYSFTHKEITHSSVDKNLRRDTLGVPVEELDKTFGLQPQDDVSQPTSFLEHSLVINNNQQKDVTASNKLCKNLVAMEGEEPQVRLTSSASFFQHSQSQDSFPALSPSSSGINIKREPVLSYDEELSNVVTETRCSTFPSNKQSTFSQQQHEVTNYPTKFYHHGRWRNNIRSYHHLRYERDPLSRRPMCPVCGKTFYNVSNCKRHLEIHLILRKKFSCPFCVRTFSWKTTLMTHLRAFHNQEPDPSQFTGT